MPTEQLLITVKTYPTLSKTYGELVCTAAVRQDGSWVRLYPVPFRLLEYEKRYEKWSWIETALRKGTRDVRPETHHPIDPLAIRVVGKWGTDDGWAERRKLILEKGRVYTNLTHIVDEAHANRLSLAVFKPTRILGVVVEPCERDWDPEKVDHIQRTMHDQGQLFADKDWGKTLRLIRKVPYNFSYTYEDDAGRETTQQILDWEIGQLFWKCMAGAGGDEKAAIAKVKEKLLDDLGKKDLHFFLGTTEQFHLRAQQPWLIIGLFYPPHPPRAQQLSLL